MLTFSSCRSAKIRNGPCDPGSPPARDVFCRRTDSQDRMDRILSAKIGPECKASVNGLRLYGFQGHGLEDRLLEAGSDGGNALMTATTLGRPLERYDLTKARTCWRFPLKPRQVYASARGRRRRELSDGSDRRGCDASLRTEAGPHAVATAVRNLEAERWL